MFVVVVVVVGKVGKSWAGSLTPYFHLTYLSLSLNVRKNHVYLNTQRLLLVENSGKFQIKGQRIDIIIIIFSFKDWFNEKVI